MAGKAAVQKAWEAENNIETISALDQIYKPNPEETTRLRKEKPWKKDPNYFKQVKISAVALLKMVTHARSGGTLEVMGMLQGRCTENTFIVFDVFALPVEGTETRVNALNDANEYMVEYAMLTNEIGRADTVVGWYHSHPGYGCWLSGIDCTTQMTNQQFQDPFLAIVVDPVRTMSGGKVEIGAFRTYPKDHAPENEGPSEYQSIPLDKIEDFGVHCKQYYPLPITFFKSSLDDHLLKLLWNKYWVNTLSSSPLLANRDYSLGVMKDLARKTEEAESQISHSNRSGFFHLDREKKEPHVEKLRKDSSKTAVESVQSLMSEVVKQQLFAPSR